MDTKRIIIPYIAVLLTISYTSAQETLRLTMSECRKMALFHSEELRQSDNAAKQAELDREIAKTAFFPHIDASATASYIFPDIDMMGTNLRARGIYMAGINLTQPIYTGGKIASGLRLARIGEDIADEELRMTRMDVIAEADNAYWTYIAVNRKVRMMESYCAQIDTLFRQSETAFTAGITTENDLLRIKTKRSEIHYQLQKARNGFELCRMSLCRIVGVDFETQIKAVDTTFIVSEPSHLTSDIKSRPEFLMLEKQVAAKKEQIRMSRAEMLPSVALTAGYIYYGNVKLNGTTESGGAMVPYSQEFRDGMGIAMLSVKIPIFHWGGTRKKVRKAQYELQNAVLCLQLNSKLFNIETQQAIHNVQDGHRLILTAEKGLQQAKENLRVLRNKYAASMASLTDLLDAQSMWQQAESNLIEAQTQYKIYETGYLRATGKLFF